MDTMHSSPVRPTRRAGSRTFTATTGEYNIWTLSRVGLTVDDAIAEGLDDYRRGLDEATARGEDAKAYATRQDDLAIWEGVRLLGVIRPHAGGTPEVTKFDEAIGLREDILTFKMAHRLTGEITEVDVIHCGQGEWNERPESRESAWLARRLFSGRVTAVRLRV